MYFQHHIQFVSISLSPSAQGELEAALNKTKQLEELRKEGGDRWLAIFNAERAKEASKVSSRLKSCVCVCVRACV